MARYTLEIEVTGNAVGQLNQIADGVGRVVTQAGGMVHGFSSAGGAMEKTAELTAAGMFGAFQAKISQLNAEFNAMVDNLKGRAREFISQVIADSATFEDAQSEMRFAFKDNWQNIMQQVLKDSADLTFTFEQTSRLASSMGRMNINPFGGVDEKSQLFMSRNGQMIRALQVLQDTADAVGKGADDLVVSIRNALSGSWKSLQDRFDIPKDKINQWKKAIDGATDKQKGYNMLVGELAKMFGGAGLEKALNWNKAIAQVPDLLQQIRAGMGAEGLKVMAAAVRDFVAALTGVAKSETTMKSLSEGFKLIAQTLAFGIRAGADFIRWLQKIIDFAPWLPKVAAGIGMITLAALTLGTVLTGIMVTLTGIVAAILAVGWEVILGVAAGLVAMAPILAVMAVFAVGLGVAMKASADMISGGWGGGNGVLGLFEKIKTLFFAVGEVISTFNGETSEISLETAEKLKKAGLWETFLKIEKFIFNANQAWEAFNDRLDEAVAVIGPVIVPLLGELQDLFYEVADALGFTTAATKANETGTAGWIDTGRGMADVLIDLGHFTIQLIRVFVGLTRVAIFLFTHLSPVYFMFKLIVAVTKLLIDNIDLISKKWEGFKAATGLGALMGGQKQDGKKGFLSSLIHEEGKGFERKPLARLGGKGQGFEGFGQNYKDLSPEEKAKFLDELVDEEKLSSKNARRIGEGKAPIAPAAKGMNLDSYLAAPVTLAPTEQKGVIDVGKDGTGASSPGAATGGQVSPEVGRAIAQAIALELAKQPKPVISVEIDGKQVAKAVQDQKVGSGGRQ